MLDYRNREIANYYRVLCWITRKGKSLLSCTMSDYRNREIVICTVLDNRNMEIVVICIVLNYRNREIVVILYCVGLQE